MDIAERIKMVRGSLSQDEFSQRLGIHKNSLGRYERGESTPGVDIAEKICSVFGVSPQWLLLGIGPMFSSDQVEKIPARAGMKAGDALATYKAVVPEENAEKVIDGHPAETMEASTHQIIMVPMVEARLSAGYGSFETDGTSERKYSFRSDFLRRKGNISEMVLMRVAGDSMSPAIEDGDVVLIDQSQIAPRAGDIYAVGVEDVVYLKRLNAQPGKIILSSFNPDYPPFEIDTRGDLESNVRIIGRVIWSCREW